MHHSCSWDNNGILNNGDTCTIYNIMSSNNNFQARGVLIKVITEISSPHARNNQGIADGCGLGRVHDHIQDYYIYNIILLLHQKKVALEGYRDNNVILF